MGYSSLPGGGYSAGCSGGGNAGFTFRKRVERVDWRKLASVDIDRISRDLEFNVLQDNIANVAFCNIECELDPRSFDPNYIKLFRLAQLIIEYLLHSQDFLSHTVVTLEERCKGLDVELQSERNGRACAESCVKTMKEDLKRYKKLLSNQKNVTADVNKMCQCPHCPKIFVSGDYCMSHVKRRHADLCNTAPMATCIPVMPPANAEENDPTAHVCIVIEKLEKEVKCLRGQLQEEQTAKHEDKQKKELEQFRIEQLEAHKKEIELIRDMFMGEITALKNNQSVAERCVDTLQQHLIRSASPINQAYPPQVCPSSPPPKEVHRDANANIIPKEEFSKLRRQLAEHVDKIVCQRMKEQEDTIHKNIRCALKVNNQEVEKLNLLVSKKLIEQPSEASPRDDLLQALCQSTKEHTKVLKKQQKKIEDLFTLQEEQRHMQVLHEQLQQQMKQAQQPLLPSSAPATPQKQQPTRRAKKHSDSYEGSPTTFVRSDRLKRALKVNPSLVQGLRDELSCMLHEKLLNHGVKPVSDFKHKNDDSFYICSPLKSCSS